MTVKSVLIPLLAAGAAALSGASFAETGDREKPIEVNSHNFSGDEIKQVAVYTGAVEVHQGTLEILGDVLTITVSPDGYRTMTVTGNPVKMKERRDAKVKGVDEWVHASALKAVYDERNDKIILTNTAKLARSENGLVKDSAAGSRITYDLLTAKSRVEGETVDGRRTRVSTVLAPRAKASDAKQSGGKNAGAHSSNNRGSTARTAPKKAGPAPMKGSTRLE